MPAASPRLSNRAGLLWITGRSTGIQWNREARSARSLVLQSSAYANRVSSFVPGFVNESRDRWFALRFFFFTNFWNFLLLFSTPNEESIATSEFKFLGEQLNCSNFFFDFDFDRGEGCIHVIEIFEEIDNIG